MSERLVSGHTLQDFDREMSSLNALVVKAADMTRDQLTRALDSLRQGDVNQARLVIRHDDEVDALELEVDDAVFQIIARRQPVAKDLRDLLAVSKIMMDLERIGDEARTLARRTLAFHGGENNPPGDCLLADIFKLGEFVDGMLLDSIRAFEGDDAERALEVLRRANELGKRMKAALHRLSTCVLDDAGSVAHVVETTLGLRGLERIGSHAAYIARHVIFLVKAHDVRHKQLDEVEHIVRNGHDSA